MEEEKSVDDFSFYSDRHGTRRQVTGNRRREYSYFQYLAVTLETNPSILDAEECKLIAKILRNIPEPCKPGRKRNMEKWAQDLKAITEIRLEKIERKEKGKPRVCKLSKSEQSRLRKVEQRLNEMQESNRKLDIPRPATKGLTVTS